MDILPYPATITVNPGHFKLAANFAVSCPQGSDRLLGAATKIADEIGRVNGGTPPILCRAEAGKPHPGGILLATDGHLAEQEYRLAIKPSRISILGGDEAGVFYGVQTLRQIIRTEGHNLPCLTIRDRPDYPVRGFYHDVTRGKVPKIETLLMLVDKMAYYKLNQLQLYIEHTFAFRQHADLWAGSDPLTHQDILRLDEQCRRNFIDLVPSFSTFGHFYTALRSERKKHLNELDVDAAARPFSWHDRMAHYTLDCSNPESLALVEELIDEVAPLFSSNYFNICCDETFDLGKGRNAAKAAKLGKGRLYVDFLKRMMRAVRKNGKTPMFWGDIVLEHPEMIAEIPKDAVALNWDYGPEASTRDCRPFAEAGLKFYVCPGVAGWNGWLSNIGTASKNITNFAEKGLKHGATGLLNTDWGDFGHVNALASAYHGLVLGAAASWNLKGAKNLRGFDSAFSRIEFGNDAGETASILRSISTLTTTGWDFIARWTDQSADMASWERDSKTGMFSDMMRQKDTGKLLDGYHKVMALRENLIEASAKGAALDRLACRELICGAKGAALMHAVALLLCKAFGMKAPKSELTLYGVADELRRFEAEYSELWHARNRPSEYFRIRLAILEAARRLDALAS